MKVMRLRHIAQVIPSNVDKVVDENEVPVRLCNYVDVYKHNTIHAGLDLSEGSATSREIAKFGLKSGDVLITKDSEDPSDIAVPALVPSELPGVVCGYHLAMLRPDTRRVDGRFLFWALLARPIREAFSLRALGITRFGLSVEDIKSVEVPIPDLATQKAIAAFLDAETARIDALNEKKQRLAEALVGRRGQVVLAALSRRDAPEILQAAETYRIGVRSDGWSVRRIKHIVGFMTSGSRGWSEFLADDGEIFLQSGNIGRRMEVDLVGAQRIMPQTGPEARRAAVRDGDVLVCITGGRTGAVGFVQQLRETAYVNQHICLLRARHTIIQPKLLAHILFSSLGQRQLDFLQYGLKQGLGFAQVGEVRVPVPPIEEQERILTEIETSTAKVDRLLDRLLISVDRLREFRAALITAAVTGQIDAADWRRRGEGDRRLDRIEAEMTA